MQYGGDEEVDRDRACGFAGGDIYWHACLRAAPNTKRRGKTVGYWLDLFTGSTWAEFRQAGSSVSGFRQRQYRVAQQIKTGDVLLCYLTGVMRWVGALEVLGSSTDTRRIWQDDDFPVRFAVKPLIVLDPENGVLMDQLHERVSFYATQADRGKFRGVVRGSPRRLTPKDGEYIYNLLKDAVEQPITRPVDPRKLAYRPFFKAQRTVGKRTVETIVSIPDATDFGDNNELLPNEGANATATTRHTEMQHLLLRLGAEMGLDVWVARNDRSRMYGDQALGDMPRIVNVLPTQFNEATQRTIELIDVLWLKGNSVVAAFEVEATTSIYSGLLRMSDLLALQPNLDIKLYLVSPDERRDKVEQEIRRPTFQFRTKPLRCGFLPYTGLKQKVDGILSLGLAASLNPDFLERTAEYFEPVAEGS